MRRVSLIAYVMSGCDVQPSVKYLEISGRSRRWPQRSETELSRLVEDMFLETPMAEIIALMDTVNPMDSTALRVAIKYVHELKVVGWARSLNLNRGVAPCTRLLLRRAEEERNTFAEEVRPPGRDVFVSNRAGKWVQRLRKRWGGRFNSIPAREGVPPEDLRAKVGSYSSKLKFFTYAHCGISELGACVLANESGRAWRDALLAWSVATTARNTCGAPGAPIFGRAWRAVFGLAFLYVCRRLLYGSGSIMPARQCRGQSKF